MKISFRRYLHRFMDCRMEEIRVDFSQNNAKYLRLTQELEFIRKSILRESEQMPQLFLEYEIVQSHMEGIFLERMYKQGVIDALRFVKRFQL